MIKYKIINNTILEVNSKQIDFKHEIKKVIEINNTLIVRLYIKKEKENVPSNNIYAISDKGEILWNIREIFRPNNPYKGVKVIDSNHYFANCEKNDDNNLVVHTFIGISFVVDIEKKEIISHFISK